MGEAALWVWRTSWLTWSGTVDFDTAVKMASQYEQEPVAMYRHPDGQEAQP